MIQEMQKSKMRFCQRIEVEVLEYDNLDFGYVIRIVRQSFSLGGLDV